MSTLLFTIIQTDLHWEDRQANLAILEKKILSIKEKTEIVILPEMFSTGFSMEASRLAETMEGETVNWMKRIAAEKKIILTGSVIIEGEPKKYFNRLLWVLPNGQYGIYDKRHLFGYADEDKHYQSGDKRLIASVKGWKINLLICYDLRFPVWARQRVNEAPEYDVLIYVANWPERRADAWRSLLKARAIENQCYVIGVNRVGKDGNDITYSGESMVIDPLGEILYKKKDEEDIYTISLDEDHLKQIRERFPFWKDADPFHLSD